MSVVIDDAAAKPQSPVRPVWTPSWTRPDATVVLTGSNCELDGEAGVLRPGVLTIEFVNQSYREAYIKVVPLRHGRRLSDLRAGPFFAGGWGERNAPLATDVWSSPGAVASGTWAIACFKDLIDASNGFQIVPAGVAGPIGPPRWRTRAVLATTSSPST